MAGFIYRENRVPHYQRLFQKQDGLRFFKKTSRSTAMLYPYYALIGVTTAGSLWMIGRQVLGHKTWFSKN